MGLQVVYKWEKHLNLVGHLLLHCRTTHPPNTMLANAEVFSTWRFVLWLGMSIISMKPKPTLTLLAGPFVLRKEDEDDAADMILYHPCLNELRTHQGSLKNVTIIKYIPAI